MAQPFPTAAVLHERMIGRLCMRHLSLLAALEHNETLGETEQLLDIRLFERHRRGLRATQAGLFLARQARQMLGSVRHSAEVLTTMREGRPRPLHIGAVPAAMIAVLQPLLPVLREQFANLGVHREEVDAAHLKAKLQNGDFELGLHRRQADSPGSGWTTEDLMDDEIVVVCAIGHPLARRKAVPLSALAEVLWLLPLGQHASADAFARACQQAGFTSRHSPLQCISPNLISSIVADGTTLAAAPRSLVNGMLLRADVARIRLQTPISLAPLAALYRTDQTHPAMPALLAALRSLHSTTSAGAQTSVA